MNRRDLLNIIGASSISAISGCTDSVENTISPGNTDDVEIDIVEVDSNPNLSRYNIDFDTTVVKSVETDEQPPQVEISVDNNGEYDTTLISSNRAVFGSVENNQGESEVMLIKPEVWHDDIIESSECWRLAEPIAIGAMDYETILPQNQSREVVLDVLGHYDYTGCLPIGEYQFEAEYSATISEANSGTSVEDFVWGFTMVIDSAD